jgi:tetratricopeptide (TPR) repeat protein
VLWPDAAFFFGGGAAGWLIAASLIVRKRQRVEYQRAIRALRAGDYEQAIGLMSRLIQAEPDAAEHYSFRATIHRMRGHLHPAVVDYQRAIELEPESPNAFAGLAETYLQMQRYEEATRHAEHAKELSPRDWSAHFLLGQAAHRQRDWAGAVQALTRAQQLRISQPTSRLLAHLWLALDTFRLGQEDAATQHLAALRKEEAGVKLWERIFAAEQGSALRGMLGNDVQLARELLAANDPLAELRRAARQSPKS